MILALRQHRQDWDNPALDGLDDLSLMLIYYFLLACKYFQLVMRRQLVALYHNVDQRNKMVESEDPLE